MTMIIIPYPKCRAAQIREYWRACQTLEGREPTIGRDTAIGMLRTAARQDGPLAAAAQRRLAEVTDAGRHQGGAA